MAKIDIQQFLGKGKEYNIEGHMVLIEPLKGKDLDLFMGAKEGQEKEQIKKLVMKSLELTSEEFDVLPLSFINAAAEAIVDVNGLKKNG